jgi:hypothetical protein
MAALKQHYDKQKKAAAVAATAVRGNVQQAKAAVPKPQFCQLLPDFVKLLQSYDVVIISYDDLAVSGCTLVSASHQQPCMCMRQQNLQPSLWLLKLQRGRECASKHPL